MQKIKDTVRKLFICSSPGCIKRHGGNRHMWFARIEKPLTCPSCHSAEWITSATAIVQE